MTRERRGFHGLFFVPFAIAIAFVSCKEPSRKSYESLTKVDAAIAKLLAQFQIQPKSIATRKIKNGDGKFARTERRIVVPPEFNTLEFNRALSERVVEFGATAIATEKSEDKSVTMHVKKDGVILESIIFLTKNDR